VDIFGGILREVWKVFIDASLYVIFGIFAAGLIHAFVHQQKIAKLLGKPGLRSVIAAALCGVPLPLCSCGVIPAAMSLRKSGASKGATLSFLISTPESGVDSIAISYALLDIPMTIIRPVAAFITAFVAGTAENFFGRKSSVSTRANAKPCILCDNALEHSHGAMERYRLAMRYAFGELLGDIAVWLLLGMVVSGVISYCIPASFIAQYLGSGWQAMLMMLGIGVPLYICASASTPIAAAFIAKGMSPGVALVFLIAGPATNAATILAVGRFLGKRSAVIYLASIAVCVFVLGAAVNYLYGFFGIQASSVVGKAAEIVPEPLRVIAAIVLLVLMARSLVFRKKHCSDKACTCH